MIQRFNFYLGILRSLCSPTLECRRVCVECNQFHILQVKFTQVNELKSTHIHLSQKLHVHHRNRSNFICLTIHFHIYIILRQRQRKSDIMIYSGALQLVHAITVKYTPAQRICSVSDSMFHKPDGFVQTKTVIFRWHVAIE